MIFSPYHRYRHFVVLFGSEDHTKILYIVIPSILIIYHNTKQYLPTKQISI